MTRTVSEPEPPRQNRQRSGTVYTKTVNNRNPHESNRMLALCHGTVCSFALLYAILWCGMIWTCLCYVYLWNVLVLDQWEFQTMIILEISSFLCSSLALDAVSCFVVQPTQAFSRHLGIYFSALQQFGLQASPPDTVLDIVADWGPSDEKWSSEDLKFSTSATSQDIALTLRGHCDMMQQGLPCNTLQQASWNSYDYNIPGPATSQESNKATVQHSHVCNFQGHSDRKAKVMQRWLEFMKWFMVYLFWFSTSQHRLETAILLHVCPLRLLSLPTWSLWSCYESFRPFQSHAPSDLASAHNERCGFSMSFMASCTEQKHSMKNPNAANMLNRQTKNITVAFLAA